MTETERKLWWCLRDRRCKGRKFRRQNRAGPVSLDFTCREACLALEFGGPGRGPLTRLPAPSPRCRGARARSCGRRAA
ncbi:MAG: DUF559 domain-containing protein [Acidobacteria bacterium]|nr:DUF559 domain-containing protein [Acidobacteriota bacterium]